jgi:hypothetical protein
MVKRLNLSSDGRLHGVGWEDSDGHGKYLFDARKPYRKIVVMVDADLMPEAPSPPSGKITKQEILTDLLRHDLVRLYRYADDGPPPGVPALPGHPDLYEGWVVVTESDATRQSWGVVFESEPGGYSLSGVMGNGGDIAARDLKAGAYVDLDPSEAASRRGADWLAAQVACQALGADLFITERPYLSRATWNLARGTTICRIDDALPLLGLYFRAQDEYPIAARLRFNRGLFFWVGTRELLPEAWRWFTACVQHGAGASDDGLVVLGGSLLQRVHRALEARDEVYRALDQPQNNDTQERALSHLDTVLMYLMAAVDVAARVAHRALGLPPGDEYRAAWQSQRPGGWLSKVRRDEPALAAMVEPGTRGGRALTVLRLLRNSVHGASLQGMAVVTGSAPLENLVGLPARDETEVLECMDDLGGREAWGVRQALPDRVFLDPGVFVDRIFEEVLLLLNKLMRETPVERLPHVALSKADREPPPDSGRRLFGDPFDMAPRTSIRWQLGF